MTSSAFTTRSVSLHVYRTAFARRSDAGALADRVRPMRGLVWVVAAPDGTVLAYTDTYPSTDLLEDAAYALNHSTLI